MEAPKRVPRRSTTPWLRTEPAGHAHRGTSTRTAIVLGDDPAATHRWHVTAEGCATGTGLPEARRLCTLTPQAAADLLTLVRARQPVVPIADPQPSTDPGQPTIPTPDTATATGIHLALLGGCQLSAAGEPVHLRRTAGLQILAYLAVHTSGATRSELTHAVWPQLPAAAISQRLHTTLADLRQQLRPLLGDDPITRHDDRYLLNTRAVTTDLQQWRNAVHAMTHAVGTTAQQRACHHVVDLYRGELAAGHTWPWLNPVRGQTRRTVVDACATLADHAEPDQTLTWLQRATTIDPYNEALHHQAADLLHAAGDHTGAADLIKRLHHRLAVESQATR
jgi:DNA-binding SARP family transcriptional activator